MTNPRTLLNLLSLSLEQGLHVFMEIVITGKPLPISYPRRSGVSYRKGDLVIFVERNDGQREVIRVYSP